MISLIIPTYNRASILSRAIGSVLAQDYKDWELIVVDDGSVDDTEHLLSSYQSDSRIKVIRHNSNRGVCAALNSGLNLIQGEWFTVLGSDDEIIPNAFSTFLNVCQIIDPSINAISCNCIDTRTGAFSGKGLDCDQYLDAETITRKCRGEFWGLTKTSLLGGLRFNEKLRGWENTLWSKIDHKARRYYIHQALRVYHTEGDDRLSKPKESDVVAERDLYAEILENEFEYLAVLRKWDLGSYERILFNACSAFIMTGQRQQAQIIYGELRAIGPGVRSFIIALGLLFGPRYLMLTRRLYGILRKSYQ